MPDVPTLPTVPAKTESPRMKAIKRFAKVAAAALLASAIGWAAGPDATDVVGKEYAVIITVVLIPLLSAAQKALGEDNSSGAA